MLKTQLDIFSPEKRHPPEDAAGRIRLFSKLISLSLFCFIRLGFLPYLCSKSLGPDLMGNHSAHEKGGRLEGGSP